MYRLGYSMYKDVFNWILKKSKMEWHCWTQTNGILHYDKTKGAFKWPQRQTDSSPGKFLSTNILQSLFDFPWSHLHPQSQNTDMLFTVGNGHVCDEQQHANTDPVLWLKEQTEIRVCPAFLHSVYHLSIFQEHENTSGEWSPLVEATKRRRLGIFAPVSTPHYSHCLR